MEHDPKALELEFEKYEKQGKRSKAVIVMHHYEICAHIKEIAKICPKY